MSALRVLALLQLAASAAGWGVPLAGPRAAHRARAASAPAPAPASVSMATVAKLSPAARLYTNAELPQVAGGLRVGTRNLVVVTGTSSGLGLSTLKALLRKKTYFVVCAVRDVEKMARVAREEGLDMGALTIMKLELGSLQSVRDFVKNLRVFKLTRPLDTLVCNAAVYLPADPQPRYTDDGIEQSLGINHVGHFLLARLLLDDMKKSSDPRCIIVGSITGNTNTIGGGLVYPRADLGNLEGLKAAAEGRGPVEMADGKGFFGAKAYKDSKVCNMMTMFELHARYHESTGITFSTIYPGCIADTPLFREKAQWFRKLFPLFMKYVTGGYVSEEEAGERLAQVRSAGARARQGGPAGGTPPSQREGCGGAGRAGRARRADRRARCLALPRLAPPQVVSDPQCKKSGVYWSWNGNAQQVGVKKNFWEPPSGAGAQRRPRGWADGRARGRLLMPPLGRRVWLRTALDLTRASPARRAAHPRRWVWGRDL